MLTLLAKILGPDRAVTVYVFLQRWGLGLGLGLAFLVGMGLFLTFFAPSRLEHVAHVTAEVLSTAPINGDARNGLLVDVRLPEGKVLNRHSSSGLPLDVKFA